MPRGSSSDLFATKKQGANWRCYVLVEVSSCRRGNSNNLWAKKQGFNCAVLNWLSARRNSSNLFVKKTSIQLRCFTLVKCPLEFPGISLRQKKQGANWWCYVLVELSSCRRGNSNNLWARKKQGFNCAVLNWLSAQGKFQQSLGEKKTRIQWRCFKLVECPSR